ncbi:hypothetical protein D3C83_219330 [compost metagenome]
MKKVPKWIGTIHCAPHVSNSVIASSGVTWTLRRIHSTHFHRPAGPTGISATSMSNRSSIPSASRSS